MISPSNLIFETTAKELGLLIKMYIIKIQMIQPGKGGAFIAVEMRDLTNGVKTNQRWRTADSAEKLNKEEKKLIL